MITCKRFQMNDCGVHTSFKTSSLLISARKILFLLYLSSFTGSCQYSAWTSRFCTGLEKKFYIKRYSSLTIKTKRTVHAEWITLCRPRNSAFVASNRTIYARVNHSKEDRRFLGVVHREILDWASVDQDIFEQPLAWRNWEWSSVCECKVYYRCEIFTKFKVISLLNL